MQTKLVSPDYCSFYIAGTCDVVVPLGLDLKGVVSTPHCIAVGCLYGDDGETTIILGSFDEIDDGTSPTFDDEILTPNRFVLLFDANMPEIMRADVPSTTTRVRIWTNHRTEPDLARIVLG